MGFMAGGVDFTVLRFSGPPVLRGREGGRGVALAGGWRGVGGGGGGDIDLI